MAEIITTTKSPWASTINWAQFAGALASMLIMFGAPITADQILAVIVTIQLAVGGYTFIKHTWFEPDVLAPSAKELEPLA